MKILRTFFYLLLAALLVLSGIAASYYFKIKAPIKAATAEEVATTKAYKDLPKVKNILQRSRQYIEEHNLNNQYMFLVDMEIASGKKRFFIYDLKADSVVGTGLVTHGRCNEEWLDGRRYSNKLGSGCTSLGKYRVGNPYNGKFGLAYKLYGLDSTNNNAFNRFVVLHSHTCVPENEVFPYPICQSDGCPTVSPGFLKKLAGIIDKSSKQILLYIYE